MSDSTVDTDKRTWLIASSCAGAVGGAAVAVPFISAFSPSERAKAAGAATDGDGGGRREPDAQGRSEGSRAAARQGEDRERAQSQSAAECAKG